jgi:flagellar capping protein FliD
MTSARKATSSSTTVTTTAGATAVPGNSISFSVKQLATAQVSLSAGTWTSATDKDSARSASGGLPDWPLSIVQGGKTTTVTLATGASLNDAAAAINKSGAGVSATVVKIDGGFKLQVTSTVTGTDGSFKLLRPTDTDTTAAGPGAALTSTTAPQNAVLNLAGGMTATSSSNTFNELLTGVSVTVSQVSPSTSVTDPVTATTTTTPTMTTISVANDTSAVAAKVKTLMDAANTALSTIKSSTDSSDGSDAPLKGNWTLNDLATQILTQVSTAVGGSAPSQAGISLNKDGTIKFDASMFASALAADPTLAQKIVGGSTTAGADNVNYTPDDVISVDGIAARLSVLAEKASDSATGMITTLANSQDAHAKDLQKQIDDWTDRLTARQATLTAQFNAMETALGTIQNQSTWLTSQINSLPSWSSSKS